MALGKNAVQPPQWERSLPRAWYRGRCALSQRQHWFDVYELPGGDFAIYEPGHFQEVISFLLTGENRALLWDTGMGIGDMRALVEELTILPVTVVLSHTHFDHMGGGWCFDKVHAFNHPAALRRISAGISPGQVAEHMTPDQFARNTPEGFIPSCYAIRPATPSPVEEGTVFDLGARKLEVLHTPGHSPDSIMLLDKERGILLTGDTFYPATLYAHLRFSDGITSDFSTYASTMIALPERAACANVLYCSHNEPVVPAARLRDVASAFKAIGGGCVAYEVDDNRLRLYRFDGFAVVTSDPPDLHI